MKYATKRIAGKSVMHSMEIIRDDLCIFNYYQMLLNCVKLFSIQQSNNFVRGFESSTHLTMNCLSYYAELQRDLKSFWIFGLNMKCPWLESSLRRNSILPYCMLKVVFWKIWRLCKVRYVFTNQQGMNDTRLFSI